MAFKDDLCQNMRLTIARFVAFVNLAHSSSGSATKR